MRNFQTNTGGAEIDVMVQPVAGLETLQACDQAGRPLVVVRADYDAFLPPNGWPCSVRIGRPGAEAVYRFGALDDLLRSALRQAQRDAGFWRSQHDVLNMDLMEVYALPLWQQRRSWLVRAAVWISEMIDRFRVY